MNKLFLFALCFLSCCTFNAKAQCSATITYTGNDTFCIGGNVVLEANAGTGYQWQLNGVNISGETNSTYTATSAGNYTVIVDTVACSDTSAPQLIVVDTAIPAQPGAISGNATPCENTLQTYSIVPVAGASHYVWMGMTQLAPSVTFNVGMGPGGTLTVSAQNSCGTSPVTTSYFTVYHGANLVLDYPTVGQLWMCDPSLDHSWNMGFHAQSTANCYEVFRNNQLIDSGYFINSGSFTINDFSNYAVRLGNNGICWGDMEYTGADHANLATIKITPPSALLCQGSNLILHENESFNNDYPNPQYAYPSYQWRLNNVDIAGATAKLYTPTAAGSYDIVVYEPTYNCHTTSPAVIITASQNQTQAPSITWNGSYFDAGPGYSTYQWYNYTGIISGATDQTYTPTYYGYHYVAVIDINGCTAMGSYGGVGVNNVTTENTTLSLYPNPGNGSFIITGSIASNNNEVKFVITDFSGKLIQKKELSIQKGTISESVQMKDAPPGIYFVKLLTDSETKVLSYTKN